MMMIIMILSSNSVQVTIAENSDIAKLPSVFQHTTRCGVARTQGLYYEEPVTDSKESYNEDQGPSEEILSDLAFFEDSENQGAETEYAFFGESPC